MSSPPQDFYDAALEPLDVSPEPMESFRALLQRVREGSEDAAWELIDVYGPHIFRAVRRKMHARIRPKFDSADFVQAVWASFFTSRTEILRFREPDDLIAFLVRMAYNKVLSEVRHRTLQKRHNVLREEPLRDSTLPAPEAPLGQQPTPSQVAVAREHWRRLVANQPERVQRILALRYKGETYEQIAETLGMHERTVRKVIDQVLSGAKVVLMPGQ